MTKLEFVVAYNCALAPLEWERQIYWQDVASAADTVEEIGIDWHNAASLVKQFTGWEGSQE